MRRLIINDRPFYARDSNLEWQVAQAFGGVDNACKILRAASDWCRSNNRNTCRVKFINGQVNIEE